MTATLLRMPEVAANTGEAVLSAWSVPEGTPFAAGSVLAVVETAKAAVDIEADADGVLVRTLVGDGTEVEVGSAIALLANPGETITDVNATLAALQTTTSQPANTSEATPADEPAAPPRPVTQPSAAAQAGAQRLFASPLARRLARDAGIPIDTLRGSGPNHRIVRRDVEAEIAARANGAVRPADAERSGENGHRDERYRDEPHTRSRAAIAAALVRSKRDAPHFYLRATADVTALLELRGELNEAPGVRISVNDLIVKAVAVAHTRVPGMNVTWTEAAVRRYGTVDLSLAVATEDGLLTPVLRSVELMSITTLAAATAELAERARAGSLRQHELDGGSATITNLGMFGTEEFAAIINPPQSSILAVGAVREAVVARAGQPAVSSVMTLTASVDHRPIDGVLAARWMRELVAVIEKPVQLLR